jgi:hypothetical protein
LRGDRLVTGVFSTVFADLGNKKAGQIFFSEAEKYILIGRNFTHAKKREK